MKTATQAQPENVINLHQRKRAEAVIDGRFKVVPFTNRSGNQSWRVTGYKRDGTRIRENFVAEASARCRHIELETEYLRGHAETVIQATKLSAEQVQLCEVAILKLGDNWQHILDAVDQWMRVGKHSAAKESPRLDDAIQQYTNWLDNTPILSEATKRKYRFRVTKVFANSVPNHRVSDFTADHIQAFIAKQVTSPTDKDTLKRSVSAFFSWAMDNPRRWATINPCHAVTIEMPTTKKAPVVLTLDQCTALLSAATRYKRGLLAPYVALCLFGGLRPNSEAVSVTWEQINLEDKEIRLEQGQTKGTRSRTVVICPTLEAWLKKYKGKVIYPRNWRKHFAEVKRLANLSECWVNDITRHTAISHYFRKTGSFGLTAEQFGNSEQVIKESYKSHVRTSETERFYKLTPKNIEKGTK